MGQGAQNERWLQRLIASALSIGIGKRELLEDYYLDEIGAIMSEWTILHDPDAEEEPEMVEPESFLGDGGERL
ncbi:MAG: hypothetical protein PHY12_06895 [Eubacteriales bacterium]|nr:hypothetical protein [Eubacteriales bacterium]